MDYIVYAVGERDFHGVRKPSNLILCEIWKGLPSFEFAKVEMGKQRFGLRAEKGSNYVWVGPDTAKLIGNEPIALMALGYRSGTSMNFFSVTAKASDVSSEDFLDEALRFNRERIMQAKMQRKKPAKKK